jgi:DNA polymerase I-like protein with 3'-5' exonuclease and polymerase domains
MQHYRANHVYFRPSLGAKRMEVFGPTYIKHVESQMGNTSVAISHMEQTGSPIDLDYLNLLKSKQSPLLAEMAKAERDFRATPGVKSLDAKLNSELGKQTALFGGSSKMFEIGKKDHQLRLFLEVLGLKVLGYTKTGQPSIDKVFVKHYEVDHPEVNLFGQYVKMTKLMGTYVKGWHKKVVESVDSLKDHCLRPGFGFFTVVTGRLNSYRPRCSKYLAVARLPRLSSACLLPP